MRMGTTGRWLIALGTLLLLYLLVGFVMLPRWLKSELIEQAQAREVSLQIDALRINPLTLSVTVEGLAASDARSRPLIRFDRLHANASIVSLFTLSARLTEVTLAAAELHVELDDSGQIHWQSVFEAEPHSEDQQEASSEEALTVVIDRLRLIDNAISFAEPAHPSGYQTRIRQINLQISDLDTRQGSDGQFSINLAPEVDGEITLEGRLSLNPLTLDAVLQTHQVRLESAWRYAQFMHGLILEQATLDGRINLSLSLLDGVPVLTGDQGQFELSNLDVRMPDRSALLAWGQVAVGPVSLDSRSREIAIDALTIDALQAHLLRDDQGLTVLNQLVSSSLAETSMVIERRIETDPDLSASPDRIIEDKDSDSSTAEEIVEESMADLVVDIEQEVLPWRMQVNSTRMSDSRLHWRDESVSPPVQVITDVADLELATFDALNPETLSYRFEGQIAAAAVTVSGQLTLAELLEQTASVDLKGLPLADFQGYLNAFSQAQLRQGTLDLTLEIAQAERWSVTGQARLADLRVRNQASPVQKAAEMLSLDALEWTGLALRSDPLEVSSDTLTLIAPRLSIALGPDGRHSLEGLLPVPAEAAADAVVQGQPGEASQQPDEPPAVLFSLDQVTIRDGQLMFHDASTPTPFQISASDLELSLTDLSSDDRQPSNIELTTRLDGYADVRLSGRVTPLRYEHDTELSIQASQLDLTTLNPYAHRYLGRLINRGQLVIKLDYSLDGRQMIGSNVIELQQIDLGQDVDSEQAVSVPLDLALALLRGPDGNVELTVPVSGQLDDPEFRIGGIVFRALLNLIVKAVASPFSLLANLLPGADDELQFVDFAPGASALSADMQARLETLAEGLMQRPGLRLEIAGKADPTRDRAALAWQYWLDRKGLNSADEQTVREALIEQYRAQAEPAASSTEPLEASGEDDPEQSLPDEATMRAQVARSIEVPEQHLSRLAQDRALAIKTALLGVSPALAERLFLLPESLSGSAEETSVVRLELSLSAQ